MASALVSGSTGPGSINLFYVAVMAGLSFVILNQGEILTYNNGLAWLQISHAVLFRYVMQRPVDFVLQLASFSRYRA